MAKFDVTDPEAVRDAPDVNPRNTLNDLSGRGITPPSRG